MLCFQTKVRLNDSFLPLIPNYKVCGLSYGYSALLLLYTMAVDGEDLVVSVAWWSAFFSAELQYKCKAPTCLALINSCVPINASVTTVSVCVFWPTLSQVFSLDTPVILDRWTGRQEIRQLKGDWQLLSMMRTITEPRPKQEKEKYYWKKRWFTIKI